MTIDTTSIALPQVERRKGVWHRFARDPLAMASVIVLAIIVVACFAAPLLTPHSPDRSDLGSALLPPGDGHLLGTDSAGRDVFARLLYGGIYTILGALVALATGTIIGIVSGLIAGYYRGVFDAATSWIAGLFMALPGIIILLASRAAVGQSLWAIMIIFGVLISPSFFRLTRTIVEAVRKELFVDASRVAGLSDVRIIGVHVLSVVRGPLIIQAAMTVAIAIGVQAGLDFLALGDRDLPSWGAMLNEAFTRIYSDPILLVWPSLAITITSAALALLANGLRDALEPTPKAAKRRKVKAGKVVDLDVDDLRTTTIMHDAEEVDGDALLAVSNLEVGYGNPDGSIKKVVRGISLDVHRGEVLGLVGESGSGKTQTAFAIMGLLPRGGEIVGGAVYWEGRQLTSARELAGLRGRTIAYIPQEPMSNLDPSFTIGHQLVEPIRRHLKLSKADAREKALKLLARVGIPNPERTFKAYPHEVSGGMAQRVLIAGAVSCDPDLLIADEPTTALDVTVQAEVLDLLRDIQKERGMGVILVTHNFGVVADICDRVAVMRHGEIVETGPTGPVFSDPQHPYTRALMDAILDGSDVRSPYQEATS